MNADQVKEILISIEDSPLEFTVVFSGKNSKKVNGLYKSESREILIHNRNFADGNLLLYTAIHEYAHHVHACSRNGKLPARAHTSEFWAVFHRLLEKAEEKGVYHNVFAASPELNALTEIIRIKYLAENGEMVKNFGEKLLQARDLCVKIGGRFEDYIDRILRIPRPAATTAMKTFQYNLNTAVGPDNMRYLAGVKDDEQRASAEQALLEGKSPDTVKMGFKKTAETDPHERLVHEKERLERTIETLSKRLNEITEELEKDADFF
ncbi:MAG: hypothetical protein LBK25_09470 [Treponema sp.]|jgi:hypothetical protein|nr:hypothetical protein [Treponema sp.]